MPSDPLSPVQRRTLYAIYDHCAEIADLARGGRDPQEEVVALQVDAETFERHCEGLSQELRFAMTVHVPTDRLEQLKHQVLPPEHHDKFVPASIEAA